MGSRNVFEAASAKEDLVKQAVAAIAGAEKDPNRSVLNQDGTGRSSNPTITVIENSPQIINRLHLYFKGIAMAGVDGKSIKPVIVSSATAVDASETFLARLPYQDGVQMRAVTFKGTGIARPAGISEILGDQLKGIPVDVIVPPSHIVQAMKCAHLSRAQYGMTNLAPKNVLKGLKQ